MTTSHSPLSRLRAQADSIARQLKAAERGDKIAEDKDGKLAASLATGAVKFAVVMDDKVLSISMAWASIRDSTEAGLSEYIMRYMRDAREASH